MQKLTFLHSVLFVLLLQINLPLWGQELGYDRIWSVQMGLIYSTVTSTKNHTEITDDQFFRSELLQNYETKLGWQSGIGHFNRINRILGIQTTFALTHSRKSAQYQSQIRLNDLLESIEGSILYNNLYLQTYIAPRFFFGQFNRFYCELGPYLEWNILNFSSFEGFKVKYFDVSHELGKPVLTELDAPHRSQINYKADIRTTDLGGALSFGTFLALPGQHMLQLELRYSRGAFLISEYKGMRQNRFFVIISYSLPNNKSHSIDLYLPYLNS